MEYLEDMVRYPQCEMYLGYCTDTEKNCSILDLRYSTTLVVDVVKFKFPAPCRFFEEEYGGREDCSVVRVRIVASEEARQAGL